MAKVIIAGGGTGGHVYPALSIGQALVKNGLDKKQILFLGSKHSIEKDVIPQYGFKLKTLSGRGLNRGEWIKNIGHASLILFSCASVFFRFLFIRPSVIIGVGGYASMPAIFAGSILRIPVYVHEQNAVVTRSNKLALKFGAELLTTWPKTEGAIEGSRNVGLPLRESIESAIVKREEYLSGPKKRRVLIMGGSLGSLFINNVVLEMTEKYKEKIDFEITHIAGKNDFERVSRIYKNLDINVICLPYKENLIDDVAFSNLVVARAGAGTCAELETLAVRSLLIPLPSAPGDHQAKNAQSLADSGLGVIVRQKDLNSDTLFSLIVQELSNDESNKEHSAPTRFHLEAANKIAMMISKECLKEK